MNRMQKPTPGLYPFLLAVVLCSIGSLLYFGGIAGLSRFFNH